MIQKYYWVGSTIIFLSKLYHKNNSDNIYYQKFSYSILLCIATFDFFRASIFVHPFTTEFSILVISRVSCDRI